MGLAQEKYKETEIGNFPTDWEVKRLGNDAVLKARIGWQGLTTAEYKEIGDYYLITGTEFQNGFINWDDCVFVDEERYKQDKNIQIKEHDVLVTKDGTIGKVALIRNVPLPATLNSGVFVIRPLNNSFYPDFFYHILLSDVFKKYLIQLVAGSTINHLYQKDFVTFEFYTPKNVKEQKAIALALSDADSYIKSLEKLIAKKRLIKQGAMQELLKPKDDWIDKKLGEMADVVGGGTPSTFVSQYWNGDINWFTPTEIGVQKYVSESLRKISKFGLLSSSARILPKGTILLTTRAGIGDASILLEAAATNQGFQSLVVHDGFNNEYLYYLIHTLTNVLVQNASGSTFLEISPNQVKQIQVKIPDYKEQTRIAKILTDMDNEIQILEKKLEKARQIKQGMMQQLLTGKIRLI